MPVERDGWRIRRWRVAPFKGILAVAVRESVSDIGRRAATDFDTTVASIGLLEEFCGCLWSPHGRAFREEAVS